MHVEPRFLNPPGCVEMEPEKSALQVIGPAEADQAAAVQGDAEGVNGRGGLPTAGKASRGRGGWKL